MLLLLRDRQTDTGPMLYAVYAVGGVLVCDECACCCRVWSVRPAQVQLSAGQQLCVVCHDVANGIHFGAITCEGCKVSEH